jgi:hypothetical protein
MALVQLVRDLHIWRCYVWLKKDHCFACLLRELVVVVYLSSEMREELTSSIAVKNTFIAFLTFFAVVLKLLRLHVVLQIETSF